MIRRLPFLGPEAPVLRGPASSPPLSQAPRLLSLPLPSGRSVREADLEPAGPRILGAFPDSSVGSAVFFPLFSAGSGENLTQIRKASAIRNITPHIIFC